ncbi:hypothetical protein C0Q70_03776 [Pomacea canaliculata]|uniref:Uncharacterized protein n=1 Tax=Pomacea canaliculata TaxID=400727 RepID=A0A2T7PTN5_POMCA|nr:hypothetical protein C0Q70_03776 [Pomacea canaliculata]
MLYWAGGGEKSQPRERLGSDEDDDDNNDNFHAAYEDRQRPPYPPLSPVHAGRAAAYSAGSILHLPQAAERKEMRIRDYHVTSKQSLRPLDRFNADEWGTLGKTVSPEGQQVHLLGSHTQQDGVVAERRHRVHNIVGNTCEGRAA